LNARKTALNILLRVKNDGAYSNIAVLEEINNSKLDKRDAALATTLVYGVLERQITLDYIISLYSKIKPPKITDITLISLRMGVYQLRYLDKIPVFSAINESVNLVKTSREKSAYPFVNAVLRKISSEKNIKMPEDEIERLSVEASSPIWLIDSLKSDYGIKTAKKILFSGFGGQGVSVRVNTLKTNTNELSETLENEGIAAEINPLVENALLLKNTGSIASLDSFKNGLFHIVDTASLLCVKALDIQENSTVFDVCAAPGGKTFTVAQEAKNGTVSAADIHEHKIKLIKNDAKRLNLQNIKVFINNAEKYNDKLGEFDRVLCDVPCSGIGIIRKKPEISYKVVTFLDKLTEIQYSILRTSARYVKKGGIMVYSTCTLRHNENRDIVEKFLNENKNFDGIPVLQRIKRTIKEKENMLTLFPHINGTDGFFISAFRRVK